MRCRKCNRPIRNIASYQRGYGPVCWLAVVKEARDEQMVLELDKPDTSESKITKESVFDEN